MREADRARSGSTAGSARVAAAVSALRAGRGVVVTDHPEREDEGDLVVAAQHVTAEHVAFMMSNCRGLICVPMEPERARALELPAMVGQNQEVLRTAFTVSVDAADGVSTGISASDRAHTIRTLAAAATTPGDLVRPGHVFPLIAAPGGVLERHGHTEAAVDLARLAGCAPVGVICEIADRRGEMLRGERLRRFARRFALPQVSIAELEAFRRHGRVRHQHAGARAGTWTRAPS